MVKIKKCSGECGLEKEETVENFYWKKSIKRFSYKCKVCEKEYSKQYDQERKEEKKEYNKQYQQENKEEVKQSRKQHYEENKEEILENRKQNYQKNKKEEKEYSKQYHQEHKEEKNQYNKQYRQTHKKEISEYQEQYCQEHKDEISKYRRQYLQEHKEEINENRRNRRKNDLIYKLHCDISRAINHNLKNNNLTKNNKSINELLPYTMKELKEHLENHHQIEDWMRDENGKLDWSKRGVYNPKTHEDNPTWQIDHEIPKSKFKIEKEGDEEFQKCWGLNNLRPYCAKKNIKEGNRR